MNKPFNEQRDIGGRYHNPFVLVLSEALFIFLPILVLSILYLNEGKYIDLLYAHEWAQTAAIFFGLTIIKLVSGVVAVGGNIWQRVAFAIALIIVFGLVPSLIILTLIFTSDESSVLLYVIQLGLFIVGFVIFLFLGTLGEHLIGIDRSDTSTAKSEGTN